MCKTPPPCKGEALITRPQIYHRVRNSRKAGWANERKTITSMLLMARLNDVFSQKVINKMKRRTCMRFLGRRRRRLAGVAPSAADSSAPSHLSRRPCRTGKSPLRSPSCRATRRFPRRAACRSPKSYHPPAFKEFPCMVNHDCPASRESLINLKKTHVYP